MIREGMVIYGPNQTLWELVRYYGRAQSDDTRAEMKFRDCPNESTEDWYVHTTGVLDVLRRQVETVCVLLEKNTSMRTSLLAGHAVALGATIDEGSEQYALRLLGVPEECYEAMFADGWVCLPDRSMVWVGLDR